MNKTKTFYSNWTVKLIVANVLIYLLQLFLRGYQVPNLGQAENLITYYFALTPALILEKGYVWQFVTYMFLHGFPLHIAMNMFMLYMFGAPIELTWGSKRFMVYYLFCGVGGGVTILVVNLIFGGAEYYIPTVGASGALFGILFAFGRIFPDTELRFFPFFFIPVKAKYAVVMTMAMLLGFELLYNVQGMRTNISHAGHIGGLLFGILFFLITRRHNVRFQTKILKAKLDHDTREREHTAVALETDARSFLVDILRRINAGGPEAITDDEYQKLRYLDIMLGDTAPPEGTTVDTDDQTPENQPLIQAYLVREIKKHL